jgi:hypothetical protein
MENNIIGDLVYIFLKIIIINHGTPKKIISNKNKFFILKFWTIFIILLGIKKKLFMSFYI